MVLLETLFPPQLGLLTLPQPPYLVSHEGYTGSALLVQTQNSEVEPQYPNSEQQTFKGHFWESDGAYGPH